MTELLYSVGPDQVIDNRHDGVTKNPIAAHPNSKNVKRMKRRIFSRDNFTCQACFRIFKRPKNWDGSQKVPGLTLGHIIPRGMGGRFTVDNLKAECNKCNNERGMTVWE